MNKLIAVAGGLSGTAIIGGATYGIYYSISKNPSYSETLKETLLSTSGNSHETNWKARLKSLKALQQDTNLLNSIKVIKQKTESDSLWTELRDWCGKNINNSTKEERDQEFQNIQNYCTFSIKEKVEKAIDESTIDTDNKWEKAHGKLKNIDDSLLDQTLKTNKPKQSTEQAVKKAIKDWCTEAYNKPYKGNDDQEFKNASLICITDNG